MMTLFRWVRTFSRSIARKRRDRTNGDHTVVVSQVRPGLLTAIQTTSSGGRGGIALHQNPSMGQPGGTLSAAAVRRSSDSGSSDSVSRRSAPRHADSRDFENRRFEARESGGGGHEPTDLPRSHRGITAVQDAPYSGGAGAIQRTADVPNEVQTAIEQASLLRTIQRLETPLRGLYAVTSRKTGACSSEEMYMLFRIWRQALGDYLELEPDERAVLTYGPHVDESYFVRGSREPGARVAVLEPCWTLRGKVALRGEAQVIEDGA